MNFLASILPRPESLPAIYNMLPRTVSLISPPIRKPRGGKQRSSLVGDFPHFSLFQVPIFILSQDFFFILLHGPLLLPLLPPCALWNALNLISSSQSNSI